MPTKIRWRHDESEETVEDAQALDFATRGLCEIVGGYLFEEKKPYSVESKVVESPPAHKAITSAPVKKG